MSTTASADARLDRRVVVAAAIMLVGGLLLRWFLLRSALAGLSSDEAVTGLAGYDLLHGHPSLVIGGATYGSTFDGWLAAPFIAVFGASRLVLKLLTVAEWLAACAVAAWALRPVLGRNRAVAVAGVLWVHSGAFVLLSTTAYLGYASGLAWFLAALGFIVRSVEGEGRPRNALLAGLFSGLALWGHPLFLVPLVPALLVSLWLRRRDQLLQWLRRVAIGGVIGASPLIVWNARNGGKGLTSPEQTKLSTYRERLEIFIAQLTPRAFGLRAAGGRWLYPRAIGMAATLVILAVSLGGLLLLWRRCRTGRIIALPGLIAFPFMAMFPNTWYADDARYYLMLTVPLLCGAATAVVALAERVRLRPAGALAITMLLWAVMSCGRWFEVIPPRVAVENDVPVSNVVRKLRSSGIKGIKGEYWVVYRLAYYSDDKLAVRVLSGPDRFPRLAAAVDRLPPSEVAYVYTTGAERPQEVPDGGASYSRVEMSGMTLYLPGAGLSTGTAVQQP